jgi:hypothetical protein
VPRQPWTPDAAAKGVTCPACGLDNEQGVRTCRNCGLPIAAAGDPLRGVSAGHVDLPYAKRSGLSATIGFVLVVALLLVGGTLAISGGGILNSGGRLGFGAEPTPTPASQATADPLTGQIPTPLESDAPLDVPLPQGSSTSFEYTCEDDAIVDLSAGKWSLNEVQAGARDEDGEVFDEIYWKLTRTSSKKARNTTNVTMQWMSPKQAQDKFGISRVQGSRAIVVTFDGPVRITTDRTIEQADFENAGIEQVKRLQLFQGTDGKVRTVIGIRSDSCARMQANGWAKKSTSRNGRVALDIERFDSGQ